MSRPTSDTDLVKRYLKPVLDGLYGMDEWVEENPPPVDRRHAYRWKRAIMEGEDITLRADTRRDLIQAVGLEPVNVLPYEQDDEEISEEA